VHASLAGLALSVIAVPTSAQPLTAAPGNSSRLRLVWQAPEGCPSGPEVVHEVERLVVEPIDSLLSAPLDVSATVTSGPEGFRLTLSMRDAGEPRSRELAATTCPELAGAAALVIALTIDPTLLTKPRPAPALGGAPSLAPPAPALQPAPVAPFTPAPAPAPPPERPPRDPTWVTALGVSLTGWIWPKVATGPAFLGGVEHHRLRAELVLSSSAADWQDPHSSGGAFLRTWVAALRGCWLGTSGSLGLGPCVGYQVGALHGNGRGVTKPDSATLLWLAPSLGGVARLRVRPNAEVFLEADALKPLVQNGFELAGKSIYRFRPSSFAAGAGVFLGIVWP
jgi:hypothetical protein